MRCVTVVMLSLAFAVAGCEQGSSTHGTAPDYFAKKKECYELVEKRDERDRAINPGWLLAAPHQCYVPTLNTCICEYVPKEGPPYVIDVMTGKVIAVLPPRKEQELVNAQIERYEKERDHLFDLCAK